MYNFVQFIVSPTYFQPPFTPTGPLPFVLMGTHPAEAALQRNTLEDTLPWPISSVTQSCPTLWDPMDYSTPSLSITSSRSLLKLRSMESVMPSNHLILCQPLLPPSIFPSIRVFSSGSLLHIKKNGQSIGASASASVPPMNTQD